MSNTHSKWVSGNLVFHDGQRWFDAFGPTVTKVVEDFAYTPFSAANTIAGWTTTLVNLSTAALKAGATGGVLLLTTAGAEDDGVNTQTQGEAFLFSGTRIYFGARLKISEATQSDFLVGLAITTTDALGGVTDGVYFRKVDGATAVNAVLETGSTETATAASTCDTSFHTYEFYFDGTNVDFWVDGTIISRPATTNLPTAEYLSPVIHFLTGDNAAITCEVDWIRAIQIA